MSGTNGGQSTTSFEADQSAKRNEELSSAVRKALPYATTHRLKLLMEKLSELGVRYAYEMAKVKERDLEGTVSPHEARKLLAFLATKSTDMDEVVSPGARYLADIEGLEDSRRPDIFTHEDERVFSALRDELPRTLDREHEKRKDIHEGTLLDIDDSVSRMSEDHDARIEEMQDDRAAADRAHKKMLQGIAEEERKRAEKREKERLEFERRMREEQQNQIPFRRLLRGLITGRGHPSNQGH